MKPNDDLAVYLLSIYGGDDMIKKIGKYLFLIVTFPFVLLWSIFFDSSGNTAMFLRDVIEDKE